MMIMMIVTTKMEATSTMTMTSRKITTVIRASTEVDDDEAANDDDDDSCVGNAAGAFVTLMIFMGVQRSYGIFYVELQEKFQVSASAVSLIGSTVSATFSLGGTAGTFVAVVVFSSLLFACLA